MSANLIEAERFYRVAFQFSIEAGFSKEQERQSSLELSRFSEPDLLREAAWVVLCSGFRERVIRSIFDYISLCFCDWESAAVILDSSDACRMSALAAFRNQRKIDAIVGIAELIQRNGFKRIKASILVDPIQTLKTLPFIGSVTALHLAKNLGLDVAKPDRHLAALARRFGYPTAEQLCRDLSKATGDKVNTIDLALWRYMAENRGPAGLWHDN